MDMNKEEMRELNTELLREHQKQFANHAPRDIPEYQDKDLREQQDRTKLSLAVEDAAFTYTCGILDKAKPILVLKARRKPGIPFAGVMETYYFSEIIPFFFSQHLKDFKAHVWDWMCIYNNVQLDSKAYTATELEATKNIKRKKKNREHEQAYITLHEQTTVTCEETGITYNVNLPIPQVAQAYKAANLSTLHPLAFFKNVEDVIRQYYKTGIRLESELDAQVLAGMLLTILKQKNLVICKDYPKANIFLQNATKGTLAYAVRYFHNLPSSLHLPALSLYLDDSVFINIILDSAPLSAMQKKQQQAEFMILNYIKACKGESTIDETAHIRIETKKDKKSKVRIYYDPAVKAHKQVKDDTRVALDLLDKIQKEAPHHNVLFSLIKGQIKMLAFMSDKARGEIAHRIITSFPNNNNALVLSQIFSETDTKDIENDLFSFTETIEKDLETYQKQKKVKVDFLSKLVKKDE